MSRELLKRAKRVIERYGNMFDSIPGDEHFDVLRDIREYLAKPLPEPVTHQFQDTDGSWHDFINPDHYKNTVEDGRWPIRALYAEPLARKELTIDEIIVAWNEKADQYNQWESMDADERVNFALSVINANALPARKPLTDDEIRRLWGIANGNFYDFAGAINALTAEPIQSNLNPNLMQSKW
jgi:hypothetical protein